MRELKLKDLAPYLPYRLMVWNEYSDRKEEMLSCGCSTVECFGRLETVSDEYDYNEVKPILRHLSDLTKEIEYNGEKFVPINELKKSNLFLMVEGGNFVNFSSGQKIELNNLPYWVIQKLHEWHFDTNNLIGTLAIDINTLKNDRI